MMKTIVMLRPQVSNLWPRNDENYSHAQASGNESGAPQMMKTIVMLRHQNLGLRNDENYSHAQASGNESGTPSGSY